LKAAPAEKSSDRYNPFLKKVVWELLAEFALKVKAETHNSVIMNLFIAIRLSSLVIRE
jgi:hypothetical protein